MQTKYDIIMTLHLVKERIILSFEGIFWFEHCAFVASERPVSIKTHRKAFHSFGVFVVCVCAEKIEKLHAFSQCVLHGKVETQTTIINYYNI